MSWSINAGGKTEKVREAIKDEFSKIQYLKGVEAEVKDKVAEVVDVALSGFKGMTGVEVDCSGSESGGGEYSADSGYSQVTQTVSIKIQPIWKFVE